MSEVHFTVDGKELTAPAGTLLIDACRKAGIEIPAFCYYPGLSPQAACRMCLVRQEKVPKLQTACTTTVAEGQIFTTNSPEVEQARKAMLELLLGNHPLDCPVCDAGGECELQDMTFRHGAGESRMVEVKRHKEEQQWSPAVFYDRPRCILCYRCIRECGEGMDVWALKITGRGANAVITPNLGESLDCEQCGNCIDICPVGALTSGSYRYKSRPWEMNHVATACAHCADGCKVTLGVHQTADGAEILRADNRDRSGQNNDFLCAKGRFGFDFVASETRLTKPLVRNAQGKLEAATWEQALRLVAAKFNEIRARQGSFGVIGSTRTTNEENYLLGKLAREVLGTSDIDHQRSADYSTLVGALAGTEGGFASLNDTLKAPAILLVGGNPTDEHPLVAWNLRTNVRLNRAHLYVANHRKIKLERQAKLTQAIPVGEYGKLAAFLRDGQSEFAKAIAGEDELVVLLGHELQGKDLAAVIAWGVERGKTRFALLGERVNTRGASDMGLLPDRAAGYVPVSAGRDLAGILKAQAEGSLDALLVVGANPAKSKGIDGSQLRKGFVVALDLFLTETAREADVVLPAASLYEKSGTVTNGFGEVQRVEKAADRPGVKSDLEILLRLAGAMGVNPATLVEQKGRGVRADLGQARGAQSGEADRTAVLNEALGIEPQLSPFDPMAVLGEIENKVASYAIDHARLLLGEVVATRPEKAPKAEPTARLSAGAESDGLFASGTVGAESNLLKALAAHQAAKVR